MVHHEEIELVLGWANPNDAASSFLIGFKELVWLAIVLEPVVVSQDALWFENFFGMFG